MHGMTRVALIFCLLVFSCKHVSTDNDIDRLEKIVEGIVPIKDSINKFTSLESVKLLGLSCVDDLDYHKIRLEAHHTFPYYITHEYKVTKRNNSYFIVEGSKTLNKIPDDTMTREMLSKGLITFTENNLLTHNPYLKFIVCKNNKSNFSVFGNGKLAILEEECLEEGKVFNESILYPQCN